ncbi:hypothetical protein TL16_g12039 [Triparma laevis f. inornata]|uniref:Uncharacterized protein n=1 Tax=Triparma laevis f. inornata TaxID=1714386 RepID=A0A9W7BHS7_9STRA|nr:hypothetical protein TL16_g12039 [Triparma laevis f. inornata]
MSALDFFKHAIIKGDWEGEIDTYDDHYYLQLGVNGVNQKKKKGVKTFIHDDLRNFIEPPENFFVFDFKQNKGTNILRFRVRNNTFQRYILTKKIHLKEFNVASVNVA